MKLTSIVITPCIPWYHVTFMASIRFAEAKKEYLDFEQDICE